MRISKQLMILIALVAVFAVGDCFAKSVSVQIREGIYKEQMEGDIDGAMKIYRKVIESASDNRRYAAEANFRMGLCLLKKGNKAGAAEYFNNVIKNYADQVSVVEKAKSEYSKLGVSSASNNAQSVIFSDSFETGTTAPEHWQKGAKVDGVQYIWDKYAGNSGKSSLCLKKTANRYFPIAQWTRKIEHTSGAKELEVAAMVRAKKASKAIIDALFLDAEGEWIKHEWVSYIGAKEAGDTPVNHNWKEYKGKVAIPENTKTIVIGLQMYGPGTVWFDDLKVAYAGDAAATAGSSKPIELAHDDGKSAGKLSNGGSGHAVRFKASAGSVLEGIRIYGSRYGDAKAPNEDFSVWLCDTDYNPIEEFKFPYSKFAKRGELNWVNLKTATTALPDEFIICVGFDPHQTKGIYMHHDGQSSGNSLSGLPREMEPYNKGDWMIRAIVKAGAAPAASKPKPAAKASGSGKMTFIAHDDGKSAGKWSLSGGGHAVRFKASAGSTLEGIRLYGSRYGEAKAPNEDFSVWLCDTGYNAIKEFKFPYSKFAKRGYLNWVNLKTATTELPDEFILCVGFNPEQRKGVYVHHDAESSGNSLSGLPGRMNAFDKGDWMIRAVIKTVK